MNLKELSVLQKKSKHASSISSTTIEVEASSGEEESGDTVQEQILKELKQVNKRLDAVENQVASSSGGIRQQEQKFKELSKLSSATSSKYCD